MKDDIHNTVLVDNSKDRAVLLSLGDIQKALSENKKGVKVNINQFLCHWLTYTRYPQGNILKWLFGLFVPLWKEKTLRHKKYKKLALHVNEIHKS